MSKLMSPHRRTSWTNSPIFDDELKLSRVVDRVKLDTEQPSD